MHKAFKKDGSSRATKNFPFGARELDILKNFKEFRFLGARDIGIGGIPQNVPIYQVIDKNGHSFAYIAIPWGDIEIIS